MTTYSPPFYVGTLIGCGGVLLCVLLQAVAADAVAAAAEAEVVAAVAVDRNSCLSPPSCTAFFLFPAS